MRSRAGVLSIAGLLAALGACGHGDDVPRPRGVLLISVDSLRSDHVSCYGYKSATRPDIATTPVIDRELAAKGLLFERAVSTTSWTLPAHMALLTGTPDDIHGVKTISQRLHASQPLLAEELQRAGYRTAGFWSGPNLHPWFGFGRGFEQYVDCSNAHVDDASVFEMQGEGAGETMSALQRASHQGVTSPKLVAEFERWFEKLGSNERFFAFVHMWDVHYDYAAPKDHDVFDPEYTGWLNGSNFWELEKKDPRDPRDVAHLKALYDAEIRYTDEHIGRILDLLRSRGRLDDTLIVFVSDHGEEFFEHGLFGHYHTLYEEVLRVPLVMRYPPALSAASRTNELVSLADVAPTILELCGLEPPAGMWGRSVLAAATGKLAPRDAPLELAFHRPENFLRGVHGGDHKVIQASKEPHARLFDLATDPGEQHPLLEGEGVPPSDPRIAGARGLWKSLDERARSLQREGESQPPADLEDDLRRTGYIGADKHK